MSTGRTAIFFMQSDYYMVAQVVAYRDGQVVWSLTHADGETRVEGDPPGAEALAGASYPIDAIIELVRAVVGFRHDPPEADGGFHDLIPLDRVGQA